MRDYKREAEISEVLKEITECLKDHNLELGVMEGRVSNTVGDAVFVLGDKDNGKWYRFDREYRICKV